MHTLKMDLGSTLPPEQRSRKGKTAWSHFIQIATSRSGAWAIVRRLLNQLQDNEATSCERPISFDLLGTLAPIDDELGTKVRIEFKDENLCFKILDRFPHTETWFKHCEVCAFELDLCTLSARLIPYRA